MFRLSIRNGLKKAIFVAHTNLRNSIKIQNPIKIHDGEDLILNICNREIKTLK